MSPTDAFDAPTFKQKTRWTVTPESQSSYRGVHDLEIHANVIRFRLEDGQAVILVGHKLIIEEERPR